MTDKALQILDLLYPPESIYLKEVMDYSSQGKSVTGRFFVPRFPSYSHKPFEYVTGEQYVRCLSQLSYVLIGFLVKDKVSDVGFMDFAMFEKLMVDHMMWFRRSDMKFLRNVKKETDFELSLTLKEANAVRAFSVCVLKINGVIFGELEFVAPMKF